MKMFIWRSEAIKQYRDGHIIVLAETVEDARTKAINKFDEYATFRWSWLFDYDGNVDPDERQCYLEYHNKFLKDVSADPEETECLFIEGSE